MDLQGDVAKPNTIPEEHTTLERDPVTDNHIILDKRVGTDITIRANFRTGQHDGILPDPRAWSDLLRLHVRQGMDEGLARLAQELTPWPTTPRNSS